MRLFASLLLLLAGLLSASYVMTAQARGDPRPAAASVVEHSPHGWFQVRVRQRVVVRVPSRVPRPQAGRVPKSSNRFKEKKIGKCVMLNQIVAARPGSSKNQNLELVTKSGRLVRAYLGNGCLAREFYAGAYIEKPLDGKLCIDRDLVHARTGAKCEIDKFRQLVPR